MSLIIRSPRLRNIDRRSIILIPVSIYQSSLMRIDLTRVRLLSVPTASFHRVFCLTITTPEHRRDPASMSSFQLGKLFLTSFTDWTVNNQSLRTSRGFTANRANQNWRKQCIESFRRRLRIWYKYLALLSHVSSKWLNRRAFRNLLLHYSKLG